MELIFIIGVLLFAFFEGCLGYWLLKKSIETNSIEGKLAASVAFFGMVAMYAIAVSYIMGVFFT